MQNRIWTIPFIIGIVANVSIIYFVSRDIMIIPKGVQQVRLLNFYLVNDLVIFFSGLLGIIFTIFGFFWGYVKKDKSCMKLSLIGGALCFLPNLTLTVGLYIADKLFGVLLYFKD